MPEMITNPPVLYCPHCLEMMLANHSSDPRKEWVYQHSELPPCPNSGKRYRKAPVDTVTVEEIAAVSPISTVTFIRDSNKFIRQHLRMYQGMRNYALFIPHAIEGGSLHHGEADDSLDIVRREFPGVEVTIADHPIWNADIINHMIEIAEKGAEKVLFLHADVVMEPSEFAKLREFIETTDFDVYKLDMTRCTINYYCDLDHGLRDCLDIEPIAVKSGMRFSGLYEYQGNPTATITNVTNHHFTGWKGPASLPEFVNGPEGTRFAAERGGWISAPDAIKAMFRA